jgi:hypothetical protein
MGSFINIEGQKFNSLLVLSRSQNVGQQPAWDCQCDCGNLTRVIGGHLKNNKTKSCGCILGAGPKDLTGQQINNLMPVKLIQTKPPIWKCTCLCGNSANVSSKYLLSGDVKSCGCLSTPAKDLTNLSYGQIVVKARVLNSLTRRWLIKCSCGIEKTLSQQTILNNPDVSCGCADLRILKLEGKVFGKLTVQSLDRMGKRGSYWNCLCDCSNTKSIRGANLNAGLKTNCGCQKEKGRVSKEYAAWQNMLQRCYNPKTIAFEHYGGRDLNPITVCDNWRSLETGFSYFLKDLGLAPSKEHSIERVDVDGNYTRENCYWILRVEQARNKRNTKLNIEIARSARSLYQQGFTYNEIRQHLSQSCPKISYSDVYSICKALTWKE